jgi:hypothetical protein
VINNFSGCDVCKAYIPCRRSKFPKYIGLKNSDDLFLKCLLYHYEGTTVPCSKTAGALPDGVGLVHKSGPFHPVGAIMSYYAS